jgi:hypothetical protein
MFPQNVCMLSPIEAAPYTRRTESSDTRLGKPQDSQNWSTEVATYTDVQNLFQIVFVWFIYTYFEYRRPSGVTRGLKRIHWVLHAPSPVGLLDLLSSTACKVILPNFVKCFISRYHTLNTPLNYLHICSPQLLQQFSIDGVFISNISETLKIYLRLGILTN